MVSILMIVEDMSDQLNPELEGWEDINSSPGTIGVGINKAIHRLVISIVNLRSSTSTQLVYLQNEIKHLQTSADRLNQLFNQLNETIKKASDSSTKLATALNRLTFFGVVVAVFGILLALTQFLFENNIWLF